MFVRTCFQYSLQTVHLLYVLSDLKMIHIYIYICVCVCVCVNPSLVGKVLSTPQCYFEFNLKHDHLKNNLNFGIWVLKKNDMHVHVHVKCKKIKPILFGLCGAQLYLIWIMTQPEIILLQFLMRDFMRLSPWSGGLGLFCSPL